MSTDAPATVLALHHGYRVAGGEERAAAHLADLAEARLGERVSWLRRDSTMLGARDAARGLLTGGSAAVQITAGIEHTRADLLHAHNLFPTFGPAALRAARNAGAAVVVHLHNYRLVCAVATTVRDGHDCTECRAGWPVPGLRHRCRGGLPEAVAYAAALPRWQAEVVRLADVVIVPSIAARERLEALGLRLPVGRVHVVGGVAGAVASRSTASAGRFALTVARLAPEKDLRTAIDACALAGLPLVIAGDGPERQALEAHAAQAAHAVRAAQAGGPTGAGGCLLDDDVATFLDAPPTQHGTTVFVGRVGDEALALLRSRASIGLATSTAHETFGLSALESMSAALPTVGSAVGALPELLGSEAVVPPRDPAALATLITRFAGDDGAGTAAADRARGLAGPDTVANHLAAAYAAARAERDRRAA